MAEGSRAPEEVRIALQSLRPLEREVLALSAEEKRSNGEIADRLGMSEARVERILARALLKLDRALHRPGRRWWHFW